MEKAAVKWSWWKVKAKQNTRRNKCLKYNKSYIWKATTKEGTHSRL